MQVDIGQDDSDFGSFWVVMWHICPQCDYRELDTQWKPAPVVEVARSASGLTARQLLEEQRNGWVVPMRLDSSPFPASEFDEEVTSDVR